MFRREIIKSFPVENYDASVHNKVISFWERRKITFDTKESNSLSGKRGSIWSNFFSLKMMNLKTKLYIEINDDSLITCRLTVNTFGQLITKWNKEYWHLELDTFESIILKDDYKEVDWKRHKKKSIVGDFILLFLFLLIVVLLYYVIHFTVNQVLIVKINNYYNSGIELQGKEKYEEAIEQFKKAIGVEYDFFAAHRDLGFSYAQIGKYDAAIEQYNISISMNPKDVLTHILLGNVLSNEEKYDAAKLQYEKAIELDPEYSISYFNLANVLCRLNMFKESIPNYNKALDLYSPESAQDELTKSDIYYNLSRALYKTGDIDKAKEALQKAISINPNNQDAKKWLEQLK